MSTDIERQIRGYEIFHHPTHYTLDADQPHGWYFWACQPGCLPDSDPVGEFDTRDLALQALLDMTDPNEEPEFDPEFAQEDTK